MMITSREKIRRARIKKEMFYDKIEIFICLLAALGFVSLFFYMASKIWK